MSLERLVGFTAAVKAKYEGRRAFRRVNGRRDEMILEGKEESVMIINSITLKRRIPTRSDVLNLWYVTEHPSRPSALRREMSPN